MLNKIAIYFSSLLITTSYLHAMDQKPAALADKWVDASYDNHSETYPIYMALDKQNNDLLEGKFITLYRAVDPTAGMHITPEPRILWLDALLLNCARPYNINGNKTAAEHNSGDEGNFSQFTSWTWNLHSARMFGADKGSLIFLGNFATENLVLSPNLYKEKEALVHGTAKNFKIFIVTEAPQNFNGAVIADVEDLIELDKISLRNLQLKLKNSYDFRCKFRDNDFRDINLLDVVQNSYDNEENWGTEEDLLALHKEIYNFIFSDYTSVIKNQESMQ